MNLLRLIASWLTPSHIPALLPLVRPAHAEAPVRPPLMLIEEVDGGYLLSSRAFARALPDGFEELYQRPVVPPGEPAPAEPECGWSPPPPVVQGRGRFFYARVSAARMSNASDYPGVVYARGWSPPWSGSAARPPQREWWKS